MEGKYKEIPFLKGITTVYPMPTQEELTKLYSGVLSARKNLARKRKYDYIFKGISGKVKVLDVGCADGNFIKEAKIRGFDAYGFELVSGGDFNGKLEDINQKFDAIRLGDVLEHTADPLKMIEDCYNLLNKNGMLVISLPNMNCLFVKILKFLKIKPSYFIPPYHLFYFTDYGLVDMLKHFKVQEIKYFQNSLRHELAVISAKRYPLLGVLYVFIYFISLINPRYKMIIFATKV